MGQLLAQYFNQIRESGNEQDTTTLAPNDHKDNSNDKGNDIDDKKNNSNQNRNNASANGPQMSDPLGGPSAAVTDGTTNGDTDYRNLSIFEQQNLVYELPSNVSSKQTLSIP